MGEARDGQHRHSAHVARAGRRGLRARRADGKEEEHLHQPLFQGDAGRLRQPADAGSQLCGALCREAARAEQRGFHGVRLSQYQCFQGRPGTILELPGAATRHSEQQHDNHRAGGNRGVAPYLPSGLQLQESRSDCYGHRSR